MRLLICGDRNWTDKQRICSLISDDTSLLIEGENGYLNREGKLVRGADLMAKECAEERGIKVKPFKADWHKYKKRAGMLRNERMLRIGKPNICLGFHNDLWGDSFNTKNMIEMAEKAGIFILVYSETKLVYAANTSQTIDMFKER